MALTPKKHSSDALAASLDLTDHLLGLKGGANVRFTGQQIADMLGIEVGTWTPELLFTTPGDAAFTYHSRSGVYFTAGDTCNFALSMEFTPDYTTAAGSFRISGLPKAPLMNNLGTLSFGGGNGAVIPTWPGTVTQIATLISDVTGTIHPQGQTSGANSPFTVAQMTSGVRRFMYASGSYQF